MKILTVSLIVILLFILCIYLEKFEPFTTSSTPVPTVCISKNIDLAQCNDNDINNKLLNGLDRLEKLPKYKNTNYNNLKDILTDKLTTQYTDS